MATDYRDIFQLDVAQRIQLVEDLWDSIAANPEALPVSQWQCEELDRRQSAGEQTPVTPMAWDEALERLRQRRV